MHPKFTESDGSFTLTQNNKNKTEKMLKHVTTWAERHASGRAAVGRLLDVTEQGDAAQDPVVRVLGGLQRHRGNVRQVCAARLLVDGADVEPGVHHGGVFGVDVDDGHDLKEHFVLGLYQLVASTVPASPFQVQSVHVDALWRCVVDVILHVLRHVVLHDHNVQGPALVSSSNLLTENREQRNFSCMQQRHWVQSTFVIWAAGKWGCGPFWCLQNEHWNICLQIQDSLNKSAVLLCNN